MRVTIRDPSKKVNHLSKVIWDRKIIRVHQVHQFHQIRLVKSLWWMLKSRKTRLKAPIFLEAVSAIETMYDLQPNLEEKDNLSISKDYFSPRTDPSIFTSIAPVLSDQSNETSWVFPVLKSKSHFLPQFIVSCRPDSSSAVKSSIAKTNQMLITIWVEHSMIRRDGNITDNIIRKSVMYIRESAGPRMELSGYETHSLILGGSDNLEVVSFVRAEPFLKF